MDPLPLEELEDPSPRLIVQSGVDLPVASVLLSTNAVQLSRPLDFLVTEQFSHAVVGSIVRVKVSGHPYTGVVVSRSDYTDWQKPLRPLDAVLGSFPLLNSSDLELINSVAIHYGTFPSAMLRYVLPIRRVKVEQGFDGEETDLSQDNPVIPAEQDRVWNCYSKGAEWYDQILNGEHPRAVVSALPADNQEGGSSRFLPLAQLIAATWSRGEQSLVIMPTVEEATEAYLFIRDYFSTRINLCKESLLDERIVLYASQLPITQQYHGFLQARFGKASVVIGSRGAVFVPLRKPGLFYCWDDTAFSLTSDRFPNFSARQVLLYRAVQTNGALVLAHYSVYAGDAQLVERNFAVQLRPPREILRSHTGRFVFMDIEEQLAAGSSKAMILPDRALYLARKALSDGPVLIVIPPDGKFSVVSCSGCGANAQCLHCHGPLRFAGSSLQCQRCGKVVQDYTCSSCGSKRLRGRLLVSQTVIDDIGVSFKNFPIIVSLLGQPRLEQVDSQSCIVVANFGSEPRAKNGYQAVLILQPYILASRTALWTQREIMRRFLTAGSLAAPGKTVFVAGALEPDLEQCLAKWDPWQAGLIDLRQRQSGRFAPAYRTALIQTPNPELVVGYFREVLSQATILGPVPSSQYPGLQALFISVGLNYGADLGRALRAIQLKAAGYRKSSALPLYIQVDPDDPGGQVG